MKNLGKILNKSELKKIIGEKAYPLDDKSNCVDKNNGRPPRVIICDD